MKLRFLLAVLLFAILSCYIFPQSKVQKIDELVQKYYEYGLFNGSVLVSEGGKIIYSKGIGLANIEWNIPNTPDIKFRLGSVTKQFTAAIIMQLVEKGKLNVDQKITDVLKNYPKQTGDRITIHHLLTHTSGIPNYTDLPGFMLDNRVRTEYSTEDLLKLFQDKELDFEPGARFSYSNSGYLVLGAMIEEITGETYESVLKKNILDPAGMTNTGYDHFETVLSKRATGYDRTPLGFRNSRFIDMTVPFSAGSMYSTVEDLYKWDQALYSNKLLSENSKEKMFTGYVPSFGGGYYGYGWGIKYFPCSEKSDSIKAVQHGGGIFGFNTMIIRELENNNLIVLLNNTPGANLMEMGTSISNILFDLPVQMPRRAAVDLITKVITEKGADQAIAEYKALKKNNEKDYIFNENNLNELGYALLRNGDIPSAIAVFKLAVDEYPNSANVYDSYAEGLLANGDTASAVKNYQISIEKNPGNQPAIDLLKSMNVKIESHTFKVKPEVLNMYSGEYQLAPNFILTVSTESDRIFTQATGQPKVEIYPKTETNFYLTIVDAQLDFVKNENGKVTHLILHQNGRDMKADKIR